MVIPKCIVTSGRNPNIPDLVSNQVINNRTRIYKTGKTRGSSSEGIKIARLVRQGEV